MGYYFVFSINQAMVKKEMISHIRTGLFHPDIVVLKIFHIEKERQFRRIEKTEFSFKGRLYDIVVERKYGDTTCFYCLHDKKEEMILADFILYARGNGRSNSHKNSTVLALLSNMVTQAIVQTFSLSPHNQATPCLFLDIQEHLSAGYLVNTAPPPKTT